MDDILIIYNEKSADIKDMLSEFNLSPKLKFTSKVAENGKINFLDTITKSQHTVDSSIYRNPTTTDCIFPYDSFHATHYKISGIGYLINRMLDYLI